MGEGVSSHTFTLPEDSCMHFLVKNLGRVKPERVAREGLEPLDIRVKGVTQLCSGHRDPDPDKNRRPTPTSLYWWRGGLRCPRCDKSPKSAVSVESDMARKGPLQCKGSQRFGHIQRNCGYAPSASCVGGASQGVLYPAGAASVLWLRG